MERVFYILWYIFTFIFGTCIFSFLNVVIYRTPIKLSFAKGRSFCRNCHQTLKPYDMVPLFSWVLLGGKCRFCKAPISKRYPLVEAIGGVCAVLCSMKYLDPLALDFMALAQTILAFYMCCMLTVIAFIDWDTMTIYDTANILVLIGGIVSIFVFKNVSIAERVIGFFSISIPMYILVCVKEGAFGGGDIKLFAALGVFFGWKLNILIFFLSTIIGGGYAAIGLAQKTKKRNEHFAFGPFICIAAFIVMMAGQQMLDWYLRYLGF